VNARTLYDNAFRAFAVLALVFMLLPGLLVVLFSFSSDQGMAFPFHGPSLRWYRAVLSDHTVLHGLSNSIILAVISSLCAVVIGTGAGIAVARSSPRIAITVSSIVTLPMLMPPLILGISLSTMFAAAAVPLSIGTAALGHMIVLLPLTFAFVTARLARFDWRVEEASRDLGAGPLRTFFMVVLPSIRPAIIGAFAIAFAASLDEFIVTFFTIGVDFTLPTLLWSKIRYSIDPSINAIGTILLLLSTGTMVVGARFGTIKI
jgi:spermidine/putrescine transport system permease protein